MNYQKKNNKKEVIKIKEGTQPQNIIVYTSKLS